MFRKLKKLWCKVFGHQKYVTDVRGAMLHWCPRCGFSEIKRYDGGAHRPGGVC